MAVTVRTFLKDGTEVTGKTVIVPPEIALRIIQIREQAEKANGNGNNEQNERTGKFGKEVNVL